MQALLRLSALAPSEEPSPFISLEELQHLFQQKVSEKNVVFGVDEQKAEHAIFQWSQDFQPSETLIAQGAWPQKGEDAHLKVLFHRHPFVPVVKGVDGVDLRDRGYVTNVSSKTPLVEKRFATPGVSGQTVTGEAIAASPGEDLNLQLCEGVEELPVEGGVFYVASEDSIVQEISDQKIKLVHQIQISGDVDYQIGNLDAWGSVQIKGSVTPHFCVRATGDVTVGNNVESALIHTQGNIKVGRGIFGSVGSTEVMAGKDLEALFIQNTQVTVGGNARIKDSLLNSRLFCQGNVEVIQGRGTILTSRVVAGGNVSAQIVGSETEALVDVTAGHDPKLWQGVLRMKRELKFLKRTSMKGFMQVRQKSSSTLEKNFGRMKAKKQRTAMIMERVVLRRQRNILAGLAEKNQIPKVEAKKKMFPNVRVTIGIFHLRVREELSSGFFQPDMNRGALVWLASR